MANSDASSSTTSTLRVLVSFYLAATDDSSSPGGDSHMEQTGMLVGKFELTPKGDYLGVAQAFCDP